jgi:hypothetical protein
MAYIMTDRDRTIIDDALRVFVRNYDGQPSSPITPSQDEVDHAKRILQELWIQLPVAVCPAGGPFTPSHLGREWGTAEAHPTPKRIPSKTAQNPHVNPPPTAQIAKPRINTGDFTAKDLA